MCVCTHFKKCGNSQLPSGNNTSINMVTISNKSNTMHAVPEYV